MTSEYLKLNRSHNCHCCGQRRVRELHRVGTPGDPDYAVAVCPTCDVSPLDETDPGAPDD